MRKLRTRQAFHEHLEAEFAWRLKEITDIKMAIEAVQATARRAIIRAGVALLYAHWEGYVKAASEALLNFVHHQRLSYRQLRPPFIALGARRRLQEFTGPHRAEQRIAVVEFFLTGLDERADIAFNGAIDTGANLSSRVFERIASSLGVDLARYKTKYVLIDSSLLERRNKIAHGEFLDVEDRDFDNLGREVISLMRSYKNDLQNLVQMDQHRT